MRAIKMIPSTGEFGYAAEPITVGWRRREQPENVTAKLGETDFLASLDQLEARPRTAHGSLVVSWYGPDLRAGHCEIRPKVEFNDKNTSPRSWAVNGVAQGGAMRSRARSAEPGDGGTPSDSRWCRQSTSGRPAALK